MFPLEVVSSLENAALDADLAAIAYCPFSFFDLCHCPAIRRLAFIRREKRWAGTMKGRSDTPASARVYKLTCQSTRREFLIMAFYPERAFVLATEILSSGSPTYPYSSLFSVLFPSLFTRLSLSLSFSLSQREQAFSRPLHPPSRFDDLTLPLGFTP